MLALALVLVGAPAAASESTARQPTKKVQLARASGDAKQKAEPAAERKTETYQPPRRGAPRARMAGGIRTLTSRPGVRALGPPRVGWTQQEAPSLFWHLDAPLPEGHRVVFTLVDASRPDPVLERELSPPTSAGIQRVRLSELGVRLEPGVEYEWFVAIVLDPKRRALDVLDHGWLARVDRSTLGDPTQVLWYDAFERVEDGLDADPRNASLRAQRAALLDEAGLQELAGE